MSPFRELPPVRLGPLDVGLEGAARRARRGMPKGGRVLMARAPGMTSYFGGVAGSFGLFAVALLAAGAWATRWSPACAADIGLCILAVFAGGASLAAVLWARERRSAQHTERGEVVGRKVSLVVDRLASLERRASRGKLGGFGIHALRRTLRRASAAPVAPWIPDDVRGRAELLLARALASQCGDALRRDPARMAEVRGFLAEARVHLAEPGAADADLAALKEATGSRVSRSMTDEEDDGELSGTEARAVSRMR